MRLLAAVLAMLFHVSHAWGGVYLSPGWRPGQIINVRVSGAEAGDLACIHQATTQISTFANVRFNVARNLRNPHVELTVERTSDDLLSEGSSDVGNVRFRRERITLRLLPNCAGKALRTIRHEFGHLLGLSHEHQHPDTPQLVTQAILDSISGPGDEFLIPRTAAQMRAYNLRSTPYDPDSVMHYEFILDGVVARAFLDADQFTPEVLGRVGRGWSLQPGQVIPQLRLCLGGMDVTGTCLQPESLMLGIPFPQIVLSNPDFSEGDKSLLSRLYPFPGRSQP